MLDPVVLAAAIMLSAFTIIVLTSSFLNMARQRRLAREQADRRPAHHDAIPRILALGGPPSRRVQLTGAQWSWIMDDVQASGAPYLVKLPNGALSLGVKTL